MSQYHATLARVSRYKALLKNQALTIAQFAARAHCDPATARGYIRILHEAGEVHLLEWMVAPGIKPIARYAIGPGVDAPKPKPKPKHPPKAAPAFVPQMPVICAMSPLTSVWLAWEKIAFNEGRQHAVLPRYDFLHWAMQQHAMQSAPVPHEEQHEQSTALPWRHVQDLPGIHPGIGGT